MRNIVTVVCFGAAACLVGVLAWMSTTDIPDAPARSTLGVTTTVPMPFVPLPEKPAATTTPRVSTTAVAVPTTVFRDGVVTETTPVPVVGFPDCTAAYYSGAHHIPRGTPMYRPELDDDDDGVACENPPFKAGEQSPVTVTKAVPGPTVTETETTPGPTVTVTETVTETVTVTPVTPTTTVDPPSEEPAGDAP